MSASPSIHATALVIGETGVLIRGSSGAGKSSLALDLVDWALARGKDAFLVADDRVLLRREGARVLASAPANLTGLVSIRGTGVVRVPHARHAEIRLVVDLGIRHLDCDHSDNVQLIGLTLPRLCSANCAEALHTISTLFESNGVHCRAWPLRGGPLAESIPTPDGSRRIAEGGTF